MSSTPSGKPDAFVVIHVGLHMAFHSNPLYTFHSTLSELYIFGAGAVGLVHSILAIRLNRGESPRRQGL